MLFGPLTLAEAKRIRDSHAEAENGACVKCGGPTPCEPFLLAELAIRLLESRIARNEW